MLYIYIYIYIYTYNLGFNDPYYYIMAKVKAFSSNLIVLVKLYFV